MNHQHSHLVLSVHARRGSSSISTRKSRRSHLIPRPSATTTETTESEGMTAILTTRGAITTATEIVDDTMPMNGPTGHKVRAVTANVTVVLSLLAQTQILLLSFHHDLMKGGAGGTTTLRQSGWKRCCRACSGSALLYSCFPIF